MWRHTKYFLLAWRESWFSWFTAFMLHSILCHQCRTGQRLLAAFWPIVDIGALAVRETTLNGWSGKWTSVRDTLEPVTLVFMIHDLFPPPIHQCHLQLFVRYILDSKQHVSESGVKKAAWSFTTVVYPQRGISLRAGPEHLLAAGCNFFAFLRFLAQVDMSQPLPLLVLWSQMANSLGGWPHLGFKNVGSTAQGSCRSNSWWG